MAYRFLREAAAEYEEAIEYYETLRPGLGASLSRELDELIALALEVPGAGSPVAGVPTELGVRRRVLRRFGIEVDYSEADGALVILAVFHYRRRPGYWKARLRRLR